MRRYNGDLANGYGNLVSRVVNMMHKFFGGVLPERGADTSAEASLRGPITQEQTDAVTALMDGIAREVVDHMLFVADGNLRERKRLRRLLRADAPEKVIILLRLLDQDDAPADLGIELIPDRCGAATRQV